jgi:6-phosphogluconolactonase
LFDHVAVKAKNIHRVLGELAPQTAAEDYIHQLNEAAESGQGWPSLDWVLLGMGSDGHTASLFPGRVHSDEEVLPAIAVTADYEGRPSNRVTLTPMVFNSARKILFLVSGENKAQILKTVLDGPRDPLLRPVQRILPEQGRVTWMVDQAAAQLL